MLSSRVPLDGDMPLYKSLAVRKSGARWCGSARVIAMDLARQRAADFSFEL